MCGILGIFNLNELEVDPELLKIMGEEISHRGPDGDGIYLEGNLGLIHKRLAILDQSDKGKQPMQSKDGDWLLYLMVAFIILKN